MKKHRKLNKEDKSLLFLISKFKQSEIAEKLNVTKQAIKQKIDRLISILMEGETNKYSEKAKKLFTDPSKYIDLSIYEENAPMLSLIGKQKGLFACEKSMISTEQINVATIRKEIMERIREQGLPLTLPSGNQGNDILVFAKNPALSEFFTLSQEKNKILFLERESFLVNVCLWIQNGEDDIRKIWGELPRALQRKMNIETIEKLKADLKYKIKSIYKKDIECRQALLSFIGVGVK